jgi:hypothetical protein
VNVLYHSRFESASPQPVSGHLSEMPVIHPHEIERIGKYKPTSPFRSAALTESTCCKAACCIDSSIAASKVTLDLILRGAKEL